MYLPPQNYEDFRGTVFNAIDTHESLWNVYVTVIIDDGDNIETKTVFTVVFPTDYPFHSDAYYSIDLVPGTYTVKLLF